VGILYRVSSDGQDEENQVPELERHCDDKGYRVNRRYPLHDKSAYHGEHETDLEEILEDIRKGIITVVVMVHSSRIDRRDPDVAEVYHLSIKAAGGRLESVREPLFGQSDISGRVVTMLAQYVNHEYSNTLSGHIRAGHNRVRANRANGTGLLGRAPFGYEIEGVKYHKVLVPTALGLKYVPEIFNRIIAGDSLATVARWLNSESVSTGCKIGRTKQPVKGWTASTVGQIVHNTVYKGQMRDSNHDLVGTCKGIVTAATFRQAADRLDKFPKRGPQAAFPNLCTSRLFCDNCTSPMYKVTSGSGIQYYRCSGKLAPNAKPCGVMVRIDQLDAWVEAYMSDDDEMMFEWTLMPGENYDDEMDLINAKIDALDKDADDYEERWAELRAEYKRLKALDCTPDEWREVPTGETYGDKWKAFDRAGDLAGKRKMLEDFRITFAWTEVDGVRTMLVDPQLLTRKAA
jgi:DNA invertase Pin-like site-specific DNA recombinase